MAESPTAKATYPDAHMPAGYVSHLLEVVQDLGGDSAHLLALAGIAPDVLQDPDGLIRFEQIATMLLAARDQLQEPLVGLQLGGRLSVTAHGVLGFAVISAGTPREALELIVRYLHTRTPVSALEITETETAVILRLHEQYPLGAARELYMETVAAAVVTGLRFLFPGDVTGLGLRFPYPEPGHGAAYPRLLGTEVAFDGGKMEICVPIHFLDRQMPLADPAAKEKAARQCEAELQRLEGQLDITDRVRQLLTPCRRTFPGQAEMAQRLCLSERTLRRRLQDHGTSYRDLLDEVRLQLAVQMLQGSHQSVNEIAYDLGYDDPSNFGRAFRRWTGKAPGSFRRAARTLT